MVREVLGDKDLSRLSEQSGRPGFFDFYGHRTGCKGNIFDRNEVVDE